MSARFEQAVDQVVEQASQDEIVSIARSRIERARIDILLDQPYLASALLSIPVRGTSDGAIRKAVVTDGRRIVYRHDLVAQLERPQIRLLIMHALMHTLLRHPERGGDRDWERWTVACDIAVELLFAELGLQTSLDQQHFDHELLDEFHGGSAETIYEELGEPTHHRTLARGSPGDAMLRAKESFPGRDGAEAAAEDSQRDAFERTMVGAEVPSATELEGMKRGFGKGVKHSIRSRNGKGPGSARSEIWAGEQEQVCWRSVLGRFMREPFDREWSYAHPNRKHLWRGVYLPGPVPIEGGRFVVAIDTSGSMSDDELASILCEVDAIRRLCACELTVVQFDADIHAVAEFAQGTEEDSVIGSTKIMRVFGRGGTDIRVPFDWATKELEQGRRISALIVCTDGYGPLPAEPPRDLPVLFLLTPTHKAPDFGQRLALGPSRHAPWDPEMDGDQDEDMLRSLGF
jgi:predicted metal-dependent peptidase